MTQGTPPAGRIARRFRELAAANQPAFIPYVTVGYPSLDATRELLAALAEVGADVIEMGIPFSDPMADGPTIQRSSQLALEAGTRVDDVLETLADFRRAHETPVVLFTYLNAAYARGIESFAEDSLRTGADGLLLTDLPLGADPGLEDFLEASPLDLVRLVAPTTPEGRTRLIAARSQGFLYYISRTGVTGALEELPDGLAQALESLRKDVSTPVAVGFGVSTPGQAEALGRVADGVVVGSALVDRLGREGVEGAARLARSLREALAPR